MIDWMFNLIDLILNKWKCYHLKKRMLNDGTNDIIDIVVYRRFFKSPPKLKASINLGGIAYNTCNIIDADHDNLLIEKTIIEVLPKNKIKRMYLVDE